jgi:hypothetical protein
MDSANGLLYIGGDFTSAGGVTVNHLTTWNGSAYLALGSGLSGPVYAITEYNGNIIVGGDFTSAGGVPANNIAMWNGSTWSALGKGVTGISTFYNHNGVVSLTVFNNKLYATGDFDSAGGFRTNNIARWNGTNWDSVDGGLNGAYSEGTGLCVYHKKLYVAGGFSTAGNIKAKYIARWNDTIWDSLPTCSAFGNPGSPSTFAVDSDKLYTNAYATLVVWNDTTWGSVVNNAGGDNLGTLFTYKGYLIEAGSLIGSSGGQLGNGINTYFPCLTAGPHPIMIYAVAGYKGGLFAGGRFLAGSCGAPSDSNEASYLEQFSGPLSINELTVNRTITVYPNPSNGVFTIEEQGIRDKEQVEVYNMLGEKIYYQTVIRNSQFVIDLSSQATGVYLYRITNTDGSLVSSGKLIKE